MVKVNKKFPVIVINWKTLKIEKQCLKLQVKKLRDDRSPIGKEAIDPLSFYLILENNFVPFDEMTSWQNGRW